MERDTCVHSCLVKQGHAQDPVPAVTKESAAEKPNSEVMLFCFLASKTHDSLYRSFLFL